MLTTPKGTEFSRLFSTLDLAARSAVIAAVSGGSDSTALLLLLKDHLEKFAPSTRPVAVTVDHALRAESAAEAAAVARLCRTIGIEHRIVAWQDAKPSAGIAAAARLARHELLAAAARNAKTDLVLTGHTADDQAETVAMRSARGDAAEEARGLAGVAPATLFEGDVWFARPLLGAGRQALRDVLRSRHVAWIDDPSNADERYERPRIRKRLTDADVYDTLQRATRAADLRVALGVEAAVLIDRNATSASPGLLRLDPAFFDAGGARPASVYALRILLAIVGGGEHLPDERRTAALHHRLAMGDKVRAVLSRALADRRRDGIFLLRERRSLPSRDVGADFQGVWDRRFRVVAERFGQAPRGDAPEAGPPAPQSLVRAAADTLPILAPGMRAMPLLAPWARHLPSFDIEPARAAASLVGAPQIPPPPFRRHIESKA